MGLLDFLKKKDAVASPPPAPSAPSGVTPVSRFDEKLGSDFKSIPPPPATLPPLKPLNAPVASAPILPPLNPISSAPKSSSLPPLSPPSPSDSSAVFTPTSFGSAPRAAHTSSLSSPDLSAPQLPKSTPQPPMLPPLTAPNSAPAPVSIPPSEPQSKVSMPQVTAPIKSQTAQAYAEPEPEGGTSTVPVSELRKVIEELRNIPLDLPHSKKLAPMPHKPPVVAPVHVSPPVMPSTPRKIPSEAFIPVAKFDESILAIRAAHATVGVIQTGNEKVGAIETNARSTAIALKAACENVHIMLLGMDEKLFKVKNNGN